MQKPSSLVKCVFTFRSKCFFAACSKSAFVFVAPKGYTGYRVDRAVKKHECWAAGVYSYFRDYPCLVQAAIVAPDTAEVTFMNAFTKKLRGHEGILSVERYDTAAYKSADARFQKYY